MKAEKKQKGFSAFFSFRNSSFIFCLLALIIAASATWQGLLYFKAHKKHTSHSKTAFVKEEKPFVIVIPSYNNSAFCEKNLHSVLEQKYENYRVIYIDDCSTDDTFAKVKDLIEKSGKKERFSLIRNETNRGALANFYHAIHSCQDNEIIVALDGDDFFAQEGVLSKLNRMYARDDVWMTYGNYLDYPSYKQSVVKCKKISDAIIRQNSYRKAPWVSSHLRTFYASLFKQIKLEDLLYKGSFYPMAGDLAMMFPLLELCGKHACFIPDILYLYNRTNPLNDHKINFALQEECANTIRNAHPYLPLEKLPSKTEAQVQNAQKADLVIFSFDRPMQLFALLESVEHFMTGLNKISVLYRASHTSYDEGYARVKQAFPHVCFVKQSNQPESDFQPLFFDIAFNANDPGSPYLIFAVDDIIVKDPVDFGVCIQAMEKSHAYGFYLAHGLHLNYCFMQDRAQEIPKHITVDKGIFGWQFKEAEADWNYPNSVDMVLYRKADVEKDLRTINFTNPNTLEASWDKIRKKKRLGLFFSRSRTLNIPLNMVNPSSNRHLNAYSSEELLRRFNEGQKIDISPFKHIENSSKHHTPTAIYFKGENKSR